MIACPTAIYARDTYNINARWTFFEGDRTDTDDAAVIYLPHTWNGDAAGAATSYYRGIGNYLKTINIPAAWAGNRIFLRVLGAATIADVLVNSRHMGDHRGASSAFTVEITGALKFGQTNDIRIVVNNAPTLTVMPTAGEENVYGGIFRGVEMIVCNPLSVSPTAGFDAGSPVATTSDGIWVTARKITDNRVEGSVRLDLLGLAEIPPGAQAQVRLLDADGAVVSRNTRSISSLKPGETTLDMPFAVQNPHLWQGVKDPYLYSVEVKMIARDSVVTDSLSLQYGFRTFGIDKKNRFTLNGTPTRIRGVVLQRDRMLVGSALTPFQIEEDVNLIVEMGANAVRVTGGRHCDYFYELCDRAGLIVWNDAPFTGAAYPTDIDFVDTEIFRTNGRRQLTEMISQLYNHPCVAVWGIFANVAAATGDPIPYIKELDGLARTLDPGRLTGATSVKNGDINFVTDMVAFDQSLGWDDGMPDVISVWIAQLAKGWSGLRAGLSYSAGGSILTQAEKLEKPDIRSTHHPETWQTYFHEEYIENAVDAEALWGVFVGNMFDFGASRNVWGDTRGTNDHGLVTFDRKYRKDAFWVYKANWNTVEPFVYIAGKRLDTRSDRKQNIKVYSNQPSVELFVGGRSQGVKTGVKGIFVWEGVLLRSGINRIEVRAAVGAGTSGAVSDRASVNVVASSTGP